MTRGPSGPAGATSGATPDDTVTGLVRGTMLVALAVGCAALLLAVVLVGPTDPTIRRGYPVLIAYLLVYGWVLVRRPRLTVLFSRITLAVLDLAWLVAMVVRLRSAPDAAAGWHGLFPTVFMGLVIFLVIGFVFLSGRGALLHAGALAAGSLVAGLAGLLAVPDGSLYAVDLVRFSVSLMVVAMFLHVLSRAKARLPVAVAAERRATAEAHLMRDMAYLDPLTEIANRRRLVEELTFQAANVGPGLPVAVVLLDLDRFKQINDTYGHAGGDEVLRRVADLAVRLVRPSDLVARLGGEEFVVVAPGTGPEEAALLAERLRVRLAEEAGAVLGTRVTASLGVVGLLPGESADDVLGRVDGLMYQAKALGRDQVVCAVA